MSKVPTVVTPVAKPAAKDCAVFAWTKRGRGFRPVRVSEFMSYGEAIARYGKLESYNANPNRVMHATAKPTGRRPTGTRSTAGAANDAPLGAGGGPVLYLAVRSKNDPKWADAPRATAVPRSKEARKARAAVRAL